MKNSATSNKYLHQLIGLVVGFVIAATIFIIISISGYYYMANKAEYASRYSYARGMYDSCMVISIFAFGQSGTFASQDCIAGVTEAMASGNYYEMPSPGFEWPPKSALNEEQ